MCGRYIFYDGRNQRIQKLINMARMKLDEDTFHSIALHDVHPGDTAFIGAKDTKGIHTHLMQWGYSSDHGLVINARSETVFTNRFFTGSLPCCAIASGYYEWSNAKEQYTFYIPDETLYLACIARKEKDGMHYVILTESPNDECRRIHDRQPVIFTYEDAKKWCAETHPASLLDHSIMNRQFMETQNRLSL